MLKYDDLHAFGNFLTLIDRDTKVRKRCKVGSRDSFLTIQAIVNHFIHHPDPMVVPVYRFTLIEGDMSKPWSVFEYSYDMKRMGKLEPWEKEIVNDAGDVKYYGRSFDTPEWRQHEKKFPELVKFMKKVLSDNKYMDVHAGNIMKDEDGYRIIDLEGFQNGRLESPRNAWIKR